MNSDIEYYDKIIKSTCLITGVNVVILNVLIFLMIFVLKSGSALNLVLIVLISIEATVVIMLSTKIIQYVKKRKELLEKSE
ncbi:hypothetical protein ACQPU1_14125 [Clostridium paraputrificum]|uniref:hypothetical protein n=1 Tax=Clostridium TaxID=1485 RepID=UPI003D33218B